MNITIYITLYLIIVAILQFLVWPTLKAYYVNKNPDKEIAHQSLFEYMMRKNTVSESLVLTLCWLMLLLAGIPILIFLGIVYIIKTPLSYINNKMEKITFNYFSHHFKLKEKQLKEVDVVKSDYRNIVLK